MLYCLQFLVLNLVLDKRKIYKFSGIRSLYIAGQAFNMISVLSLDNDVLEINDNTS
jgi:hypothetical protein